MSSAEYQRRRAQLMKLMAPGSIAVLPSAREQLRNRDTEHLFRQSSDFYYLTGFDEPNAVLVLAPGREHGEVILFCQEREPGMEQWTGERMGPDRASQMLGVDDSFPIGDLGDILPGLLEGRERVYANFGEHPEFDRDLLDWVKRIRARQVHGAQPPGEFLVLSHLLHDLRLYKTAHELKLMRRAAEITTAAHVRAMRSTRPGGTEAGLEAEIVHEFMRNGARFPAYPCIVGAGKNACVMHYVKNDAPLKDGDLVLIDAGCEYQYYACDVTRTFPINGKYSPVQRALYEIVLQAQLDAIATIKPGAAFNAPHETAVRTMTEGLVDLKLLKGDVDELIETEAYKKFCVHKSSHWLGLDVHDVGDYRIENAWRTLEPGMVLTIEPGIYMPSDDTVPAKYRGIGIRIEDDVLVVRGGHEVLTAAAPKTVKAIEATMRKPIKPAPQWAT
jgi:Xaa-Pro aminopeptidase